MFKVLCLITISFTESAVKFLVPTAAVLSYINNSDGKKRPRACMEGVS